MGYMVYHLNSGRSVKWYRTQRGAKIGCTAMNRNAKNLTYDVMEEAEFNKKYNGYVTVKSMMNGQDVQIRAQDVGGCCDPSTERYWSM